MMRAQKADGLETSTYLDEVAAKHISGEYSIADAGSVLRAYYADKGMRHEDDGFDNAVETGETNEAEQREKRDVDQLREQEADMVSCRIVELLGRRAFDVSPAVMSFIHRTLFQDLDPEVYQPGVYKTDVLVKSEFILNGDSVLYAERSSMIRRYCATSIHNGSSRRNSVREEMANLW